MFSLKPVARYAVHLCNACLVMLPMLYGGFLIWHEWRFRERQAVLTPGVTTAPAPVVRPPLDTTAIASVFGLSAETPLLPSAEPLTLLATLVTRIGLSKALLADSGGQHMYRVGERLPGGSVLRRVEATHVVLWKKGREELLALQPSAVHFLRSLEPQGHAQSPDASARYLRPLSGLSE
jgi:hypothetical protein